MSFDVGTSELLTFAGLVIGAIFTYLGVKATVSGQRDAARPADWQAFTQEMKSYFQEQLAERDRDIAEDRQRIARDLHDTVIQDLIAIGMQLDAGLGHGADPEREQRDAAIVSQLEEAVRRLRGSVFDLRHPVSAQGLADTVRAATART